MKLKPLVKTIGGKTKLAPKILEHLPAKITGRYHEPFCGGAAVFCALWNDGRLNGQVVSCLNDANAAVINLLRIVRDYPDTLNIALNGYQTHYDNVGDWTTTQKFYYEQRDLWNAGQTTAERFMFLKATGFNGLWRVNKSGELNTAWGKYGFDPDTKFRDGSSPLIADDANILAWSAALQLVELHNVGALSGKLPEPEPGDVVYLDPPYLDTFNSYTAEGFTLADHAELLRKVWEWTQKGVFVAYSNSSAAEGLISVAWPEGVITTVSSSYTVNTDGDGRAPTAEILAHGGKLAAPAPKRVRTAVRAA